jgi:hypothetical protein
MSRAVPVLDLVLLERSRQPDDKTAVFARMGKKNFSV